MKKKKTVSIKVWFQGPTYHAVPTIFRKNGKKEWTIRATSKTDFDIKLRKLRKKLKLHRGWSTLSNDWAKLNVFSRKW